ncbi:hypothetical protein V498_03149 [Pseudogymnoascus sp. VKM F-4517 (FW-2822)]|nr:hypothetical protein V498_03149 [Pseudogymnoascus sp. VKM F-4517 (FW-2822)]
MLKWAAGNEHEGKFEKRVMQRRPKRNAHGDDIGRIQRQNSRSNSTAAAAAGAVGAAEYHRPEILLPPFEQWQSPSERQDALARRTGDAAPTKCVVFDSPSHEDDRVGNLARLGLPFWRLRNASLHPALANDMAIPGGWIAGVASKLSFLLFPSTGPAAGCLSLVVVSVSPCLFCPVCLGACLDLGIGQVYSSEYCHPRAICGAEAPDGSRHGEQDRFSSNGRQLKLGSGKFKERQGAVYQDWKVTYNSCCCSYCAPYSGCWESRQGKRREAPGGLVLSFKGRSLTPTEARAFVDPVHPEYPARMHLVLKGTEVAYCAFHCIGCIFVVIVARVNGTGRGGCGGGDGGDGGSNGGGVHDDDGVDEDTIGHHKTLQTRSSEHRHEPYHTCHRQADKPTSSGWALDSSLFALV